MIKVPKKLKGGFSFLLLGFLIFGLISPVSANSVEANVVGSFEEEPTNNSDYSKEEFINSLKESGDEIVKFGLNNEYYTFEEDGTLVIDIPENPVIKKGTVAPACIACVGGAKITT